MRNSLTGADHKTLAAAIETGDVETVESLLEQYPELVNHPSWTPPPLHCAVLWNQPKVADVLIACGADIEALDPDRRTTAIRYAVMYCKIEVIPLLLSHGANPGPIVDGGPSALQLAIDAANGAFAEYDDLPDCAEYAKVVDALRTFELNNCE